MNSDLEPVLAEPPSGLVGPAADFWNTVVRDYELDEWQLHSLTVACSTYQLWNKCQAVIEAEGPTFVSSSGLVKMRPEVAIADKAATQFRAYCRELYLQAETVPDTRPPRIGGGR